VDLAKDGLDGGPGKIDRSVGRGHQFDCEGPALLRQRELAETLARPLHFDQADPIKLLRRALGHFLLVETDQVRFRLSPSEIWVEGDVLIVVQIRQYIWMRGFRYFIQFYPGGAYVTEYWLYDSTGKRVGCETYAEGELGPSVCGTAPIVN
jgi:hypothetical protein